MSGRTKSAADRISFIGVGMVVGTCSPRFLRSTMYNIPCTGDLLKHSHLPFVVTVVPFARLHPKEVCFVDIFIWFANGFSVCPSHHSNWINCGSVMVTTLVFQSSGPGSSTSQDHYSMRLGRGTEQFPHGNVLWNTKKLNRRCGYIHIYYIIVAWFWGKHWNIFFSRYI